MPVVLVTCSMSQLQQSVFFVTDRLLLRSLGVVAQDKLAQFLLDKLLADCMAIVGRDAVPHGDRGDWRRRCSRRQQW